MVNALAAFQQEFARFLLQENFATQSVINAWLKSARSEQTVDPLRVDAGLRVYRNNVIYSLTRALAAQFPVVHKLVGPEFFGALATDYVRQSPPVDPALTLYGDQFASFITAHPACQPLPYLADVASLELQCQLALHAADEAVLEVAQLGALPPEQLATVRLALHASAFLLASHYPVDRIWAANLDDSPEEIRLDMSSRHHMLIYRRELQVQVVSLQPAAYALLQQLQAGCGLQQASSLVQEEFQLDDTELAPLLSYLLGLGVFSRFTLQPEKELP